jgi:DNA-binding transcriptional LysR family regulator
MKRAQMADLTVFLSVAEERSFTRAAAKLGISQSALSQIMRRLESSLGLRLLTRTTRSVAPTDAGERLLETLAPAMVALDDRLAALRDLRDTPAGTIRITSVEHAAATLIYPAIRRLLSDYPDIAVDVTSDYGLTDIVAERFDAGVRLGEQVDKDMIAVPIGPDMRQAVVASPAYFARHPRPNTPRDLTQHRCINFRLSMARGFYSWVFAKAGRELRVRVEGPLAFNTIDLMLRAALDGFGLAYLPEDVVGAGLADGSLVRVLEDWCPRFPGYHLYYPSRRQPSSAFKLFVDTLRYRN